MVDPRRRSAGFINQYARSIGRSAISGNRAREAWDWPGLQALALREARRYLDAHTAQDAAQEATLRAWRSAESCAGPPEPWIRTIARNEAMRIASRRPDHLPLDEHEPATDAAQIGGTPERLDVARALAVLTRPERQALFLRYWAGSTDSEISSELGCPVGTVKIRLHRARAKLAGSLLATDTG
jgi:RNA polymerase sigma-70 factor (ECF subfamily)